MTFTARLTHGGKVKVSGAVFHVPGGPEPFGMVKTKGVTYVEGIPEGPLIPQLAAAGYEGFFYLADGDNDGDLDLISLGGTVPAAALTINRIRRERLAPARHERYVEGADATANIIGSLSGLAAAIVPGLK